MALEIRRNPPPLTGVTADRRLYLTRDRTRLVEEGDPEAGWLLASPGTVIPTKEVTALRLVVVEGKVTQLSPSLPAGEPAKENGKHRKGK